MTLMWAANIDTAKDPEVVGKSKSFRWSKYYVGRYKYPAIHVLLVYGKSKSYIRDTFRHCLCLGPCYSAPDEVLRLGDGA